MTYYKATRPDGRSFWDGTTRWEVGSVTSLPKGTRRGTRLCGANVLHAATVPAESLVGGSWPCRLFAVEPKGKLLVDPEHPHKVGCRAWLVVEELAAWQALGPNGQAVAALIERCKTLTPDEVAALAAAGAAAGAAVWAAAGDAARAAARYAAWDAALDAARDAARAAALDGAWDAAMALVVQDLISPEHFDVLYGPWSSVMEGADERGEG